MKRNKRLILSMAIVGALGISATVQATVTTRITPTVGRATVDGDISEWNTSTDFSVKMCTAGSVGADGNCTGPGKVQLSTMYSRYDCNTNTMYVLVLETPGHQAVLSAPDAWVTIGGQSSKVVNGSSGKDGTPPDFAWVYSNGDLKGYEASFPLAAGTYNPVEVHLEVDSSQTSSTGKNNATSTIIVPENCTMPAPTTTSSSNTGSNTTTSGSSTGSPSTTSSTGNTSTTSNTGSTTTTGGSNTGSTSTSTSATAGTTVSMPTNSGESAYIIALTNHVGNSWTYNVAWSKGKDLSHWDLSLGSCLSHVTDAGGGGVLPGGDPSNADPAPGANTSVKGSPLIKWDTTGGTFTITLDGDYPTASIPVLAKTATVYNTGMVAGPDCSTPATSSGGSTSSDSGSTDTPATSSGNTGSTGNGNSGNSGSTGNGNSGGNANTGNSGGNTDTSNSAGNTDTGNNSGNANNGGNTDNGNNGGNADNGNNGTGHTPVTICHNPVHHPDIITIDDSALAGHGLTITDTTPVSPPRVPGDGHIGDFVITDEASRGLCVAIEDVEETCTERENQSITVADDNTSSVDFVDPTGSGNSVNDSANGRGHQPVAICHNVPHNPHVIVIDDSALQAHLKHLGGTDFVVRTDADRAKCGDGRVYSCGTPKTPSPWATSFKGGFYNADTSVCSYLPNAVQDKKGNNMKGWTMPQWIPVNAWLETDNANGDKTAGLKVKVSSLENVKFCPAGAMTTGSCTPEEATSEQEFTSDANGRVDFIVMAWWPGVPKDVLANVANGKVENLYSVTVKGGETGEAVLQGSLSKDLLWTSAMMNHGCTLTLSKPGSQRNNRVGE